MQTGQVIKGYHTPTKLSEQIYDQWTQLRSNSPSARAERERAVLTYCNNNSMFKHSTSDSVNTLLSLCAVVVQANTSNSENDTTNVSDGKSSQDHFDFVNQLEEVIDQGESSQHSFATDPVQSNNYSIRQAELKEQTKEVDSKEFITVSRARTRLWRKHSTMARLQATWKQKGDEELVQKKCVEEKEAQKKSVQEGQFLGNLYRDKEEKVFRKRTQEELDESKERLLNSELKFVQEATTPQEEFTKEIPTQLHSPNVVLSPVAIPPQPASALPSTQQQSIGNLVKLVFLIVMI